MADFKNMLIFLNVLDTFSVCSKVFEIIDYSFDVKIVKFKRMNVI